MVNNFCDLVTDFYSTAGASPSTPAPRHKGETFLESISARASPVRAST